MDDIQGSSYDYAFIPSRHAADCISRWEKSGSPVKLIVMLNTDDMSSSRRVGSVHLPIYSCVLANILNGVTDKHLFHSNRIAFTAPAAKILVVDDLPTNLRVAEELMSPYDMKVDTCLSGSEALDLIQQNHYDLIFMDHMMPEMDGLMATDLIRKLGQETGEHDYYRNLPIIMLTANAVAGQREMFLKNGINEFLPKPIDVRKLNIVLETWIPQDKQRKGKVVQPEEDSGPFPAIPGVDTGVGLQNTGSSAGAYRRILSLFCGDVDERLPQIKKAAAEGDYPMYTTMVHAIKGAARSIGALAVGERAAELEAAGRGGDTALIAEKTGPLLEELAKLTGNIRAALGEQGNRAELLILADLKLEALKDALNAMDTAAVDAHLSGILARSLDQKTREYIGEIEQHILLFEYDKAVKMIDKVLSQSPLGEDHD
jgi:CheY-like chemotaxis protein